ncbi:MAG: YceH family protein [Wenzhouxiangella sp.]
MSARPNILPHMPDQPDSNPGETENQNALPLEPPLDAEEARVLGCLIEKESTTPESYPLTQNATVTACNQKTSRQPVMKLDPGRVGQALRKLEQRGLVKSDFGARAARYRHRVDTALSLTPAQRTLIGLLLLRGPQTLAELLSRSERMHQFDDLDDVRYNLDRLAGRDEPMVVCIGRAPGQREDRYTHRLCGEVDAERLLASMKGSGSTGSGPSTMDDEERQGLLDRIEALESRLAAVEQHLGLSAKSEENDD